MALSKTIELVSNFGDTSVFNNPYIAIKKIEGYKDNILINVIFKKAKDNVVLKQEYYSFAPALEGDNFIKQAYLYLKTLPEFADAIDC